MASARTLQPQDQIAHYRIVGPLGAGGMGEVYLAQDQTLERNVALKILPPELVQSEERVRRFVREAKSASSLNHPNIVTIYEIGQDDVRGAESGGAKEPGSSRLHYISMELVSGDTLTTKIHHDKTDLRTLLGYLAQVAEGLAKAHAAGIVHRDLKPGNIMVSKDGFAKVLDFGLAKLTEKAPTEADVTSGATHAGEGTSAGAVLGTVGYMSPEQVRGATVDHRSDIFSFGCILYEAATRTKPFMADSNVETMHKILHDKPTPVEEINKDVPTEVRRLIRRCLAKSPDQRFQSAKDLAIELREIVDEYDSLTPSGSSGSGSSALGAPPAPRRKISPAAWIAGVVVLGVVVAGGLILARGGGKSAAPAAPPAIKVSTVTNRGSANGAALSPDGRYLAYSLFLDGSRTLWVRQVATGSDVQILPPQKIAPTGLTFTPDGNYLYYQSADPDRDGYTAVFEVPALGGTPRKRAYDVDSRVTFSPDGKQICFRRGEPHKNREVLVVLDLDGGKERVLASASPPLNFVQPAWSPDGKKVAVIEAGGGGALSSSVATYSVADGKRSPLGKAAWAGALDLTWFPDGSGLLISVFDPSTFTNGQLVRVAYPGGETSPLTSGADGYGNLSVSADGGTIAAVRFRQAANLWVASPTGARAVRQVTFGSADDGGTQALEPGPDSTVFYSAVKDGHPQIFAIGADGSNERSLTAGQNIALNPFFRPGAGIIYSQSGADLVLHIWRMDEHGENARQITTGTGELLVDVSSDGRVILFNKTEDADVLWSVSSDGGTPIRLGRSVRSSAQFSPDGSRIAHTAIREVNGQGTFVPDIIPTAGGPGMAPPAPPRVVNPRWTPDGNGVSYTHASNEFRNLYRLRLNGSPEEITHFSDGRLSRHEWSPDGKRLLLLRSTEGNATRNLWVTDADGSNPVALTDFRTGDIADMKWASDGSRVYFTYGESSQNVVLIRNFR
ncbi:MAG TPA: protein kinase [Candidatus Eisenbacteria bacterium]|nr:protein kinase [Candidatus Eisenbacteria bacterium]